MPNEDRSPYNRRVSGDERKAIDALLESIRGGGAPRPPEGPPEPGEGAPPPAGTPPPSSNAADVPAPSGGAATGSPVDGMDDLDRMLANDGLRPLPGESGGVEAPSGADGVIGPPGGDSKKTRDDWRKGWQEVASILRMLPPSGLLRDRERVLRYLVLYPIPRLRSAPFVLTVGIEEVFNLAGIPQLDRDRLLRTNRKLALAFYSNLLEGGDGLAPVPP